MCAGFSGCESLTAICIPGVATHTKDDSILGLVEQLAQHLDSSLWKLVDHSDCDLMSISIARRDDARILVYVSTLRRAPGRYDYECEDPPEPGSEWPYRSVSSAEDVTFEELLQVIRAHLGRNHS